MLAMGVHFSDVVEAVMNESSRDYDDESKDMEPTQEPECNDPKNPENRKEKKPRQNKSYVTAKTLNDREERRLLIKLNHYDKELKQNKYQIDVAQRAIRKELLSINPDLMSDPNKGFFIPKGMTQEQADIIKARRLELMAASNTRSMSLDEFTAIRRRKSEMGRQALHAIQHDKPEGEEEAGFAPVKGRDRWKALANLTGSNAASFSRMAKVSANMAATNNGPKNPPATADTSGRNVAQAGTALRGITR